MFNRDPLTKVQLYVKLFNLICILTKVEMLGY